MASTIEDLYETYSHSMLKERKAQTQKMSGLGPDDLVVLVKQEKNIVLTEGPQRNFYHCVCGLNMESPASFSAYFANLLLRQEKGSFSKKTTIKRGVCYVWNSFNCTELVASLQTSGECTFKSLNAEQNEVKTDDLDWKQIKYSSALRFYRASQPLLFAFFGSNPVSNSITRVFFPSDLKLDDLIYIAENHPVSDELQSAIAGALLLSVSAEQIIEFITRYADRFRSLLSHIMRYVPIESPFAKKLIPLFSNHYNKYPDDIDIAAVLLYLCPSMPTPIVIYNSLWCSPIAGIALARKYINDKQYNNAFLLLNVAAYSRGWPSLNVNLRNIECERPKKAPERGPSIAEAKLVNAPLVGANTYYFSLIAELQDAMGQMQFMTLVRTFAAKHKTGRCTNELRPFPFEKHVCGNDSENFLFDPGEHIAEYSLTMYDQFAFSQSYQDVISDVQKAAERRKKVLSGGDDVSDITSLILLGIRLKDKDIIKYCFNLIKSRNMTITATDQMMFMKCYMIGITSSFDEIIALNVSQLSITQQNAFGFMKCLSLCLRQLSM